MCRHYGFYNDPSAFAELESSEYIFVNAGKLITTKENQPFINYLYLHEISHILLHRDEMENEEEDAHRLALKLAEEHNIKINYEGVVI